MRPVLPLLVLMVLMLMLMLMLMTAWADVPKVATDIAPLHSLVAHAMSGVACRTG
jgi:zinc transport system substrate-binding protein